MEPQMHTDKPCRLKVSWQYAAPALHDMPASLPFNRQMRSPCLLSRESLSGKRFRANVPGMSEINDQPAQEPQATDKPPASPPPKEIGGPKGPEPTRYGDWEVNGRCTDF